MQRGFGASNLDYISLPQASRQRPRALFRLVANGFDIVSVRIDDEGAVVVWMVNVPDPRCTVVFAAGRKRRFVEFSHLLAVGGGERNVDRTTRLLIRPKPELGFARKLGSARSAEPGPPLDFGDQLNAERRERRCVESFALRIVCNWQS